MRPSKLYWHLFSHATVATGGAQRELWRLGAIVARIGPGLFDIPALPLPCRQWTMSSQLYISQNLDCGSIPMAYLYSGQLNWHQELKAFCEVETISLFCLGVQEQLGEVRFVFDLVQHVGHCSQASGHSERSVAPRRQMCSHFTWFVLPRVGAGYLVYSPKDTDFAGTELRERDGGGAHLMCHLVHISWLSEFPVAYRVLKVATFLSSEAEVRILRLARLARAVRLKLGDWCKSRSSQVICF